MNEIINVEIPFPLFPIVSGCKTRHAIPSIQSFPIISSVLPLESHAARSRSSPGFSILYYPFLQRAGGERAGVPFTALSPHHNIRRGKRVPVASLRSAPSLYEIRE